MPVTEAQYNKAKALIESGKASPEVLKRLQSAVDEYVNVNQYGPPTSENATYQSADTSLGGYFYEPSVEDFRVALSNPAVRQQLGLQGYASDKSAGEEYLASKVPELQQYTKKSINALDKNSPEYKAYAEYAYKQAQQKDPTVKRYSELSFRQNPFETTNAFLTKAVPAVTQGLDKTLTLGSISRAGRKTDEALSKVNKTPITDNADRQAIVNRIAPELVAAGQVAGYGSGSAPANAISKAGENLLNYAGRGVLGKALVGGGVSGATNVAESAAQKAIAGEDVSFPALGVDALIGAGGGFLGDLGSQAIGAARTGLRNTPTGRSVKTAEEAGARTGVLGGLVVPENIKENIAKAGEYGSTRHAVDIASEKIAPQMAENISKRSAAAEAKAAENLEKYAASPAGQQRKSMRQVAEGLVDLAGQVTRKLPSGAPGAIDPRTLSSVQKELREMSELRMMPAADAEQYLKNNPGAFKLDENQIGIYGGKVQQGMIPIVDVADMNAKELIELERRINKDLKYAQKEGGADIPTLKRMEEHLKTIRDQFKDYPDRRQPGRPTDSEFAAMSPREKANTPISEIPEPVTAPPGEPLDSSIGPGDTAPPPVPSDLVPPDVAMGNKRYQEPTASEYAKMAAGENVDKSANAYQRLVGPEDFAPDYRLKANQNEISNLNQLVEDTTKLDAIYKANPGISEDEAIQILDAQKRLTSSETAYKPEFPVSESTDWGWSHPFQRDRSPFSPSKIGPKESIEDIPAEEIFSSIPAQPASSPVVDQGSLKPDEIIQAMSPERFSELEAARNAAKNKPAESLFPEVPDIQPNIQYNQDVNIEYLDDGTRVTGLSALQRRHHLSAMANEEARRLTQADNPENMTRQIQSFNSGPGRGIRDDAMLAEARAMGMEPQLREVAGTREAQNLHNRLTSGGYLDRAGVFAALRLDPIAAAISGAPPNPFAPMPTPSDRIRQYMFELLNQRAGRGAARFGNEIAPAISDAYSDEDLSNETKNY